MTKPRNQVLPYYDSRLLPPLSTTLSPHATHRPTELSRSSDPLLTSGLCSHSILSPPNASFRSPIICELKVYSAPSQKITNATSLRSPFLFIAHVLLYTLYGTLCF